MTFTFTMDAFPDYTKFNATKKVLAALEVITEAAEAADEVRQECGPIEASTKDENITLVYGKDNVGNSVITMTAEGTDIDGRAGNYDKELFGDIPGNATELELNLSVEPGKKYRVVQTNPALGAYFSNDPAVTGNIKDKTYEPNQLNDGYALILSDKDGSITVELYDVDSDNTNPRQKVTIDNKLKFKEVATTTYRAPKKTFNLDNE